VLVVGVVLGIQIFARPNQELQELGEVGEHMYIEYLTPL
jgi:hypothetical protein